MSDGQSDAFQSKLRFEDKARAKYGHLSKEEVLEKHKELQVRLEALKVKRRALEDEYQEVDRENNLLRVVFFDDLNGRRRK